MQGGRESRRERAEVVGEAVADNMLSLCKNERKAAITEKRELLQTHTHKDTHRESKLCGENDEDLVSGDQNKELIKDEAAAHSQRGHSQCQMRERMQCLTGMKAQVSKHTQG